MSARTEQFDPVKRVEDLTRQIEHHRFCYYVLDRPDISDPEFDRLYKELEELEAKYPELRLPTSPTQKIGAAPSTEFKQVRHSTPMLSLANAMGKDELVKWEERIFRTLELDANSERQKLAYVCELKIDGLSCALTYRNGHLINGATRGNGEVGEDVTLNLKTIASIPHQIKLVSSQLPDSKISCQNRWRFVAKSICQLAASLR